MADIHALYDLWLKKATLDPDLQEELRAIAGDEEAINDRFWTTLAFGTGGLRGVIGAGTNRMNVYTVSQATQGLANYLNEKYDEPTVAIAYDSRIKSDVFAKAAAGVLAANGIKVYFYDSLTPTPMLSYAIRKLGCQSGIVITASHNPSKYNGYKCYNINGYQMTDAEATELYEIIQKVDMFDGVKRMDFEDALADDMVDFIEEYLIREFYDDELLCRVEKNAPKQAKLKLIYTPLNGTGNRHVRHILKRFGFDDVQVVKSQEKPDGTFPTCPFPNPEIKQVFEEAFKMTEKDPADLIIATDPDADRVGIAVRDGGEYHLMSGNEVGCMLTDYLLSRRKARGTLPENPVIVKTIVTTELVSAIAKDYGAEVVNLLTGFKYIGEYITEAEKRGEKDRYVLGFEESYGYLNGTHVREKDAVNAAMMIAEMAAYEKLQGKTLYAYMQELYAKYGMYQNTLLNFGFEGEDGMKTMLSMMEQLRSDTPQEIAALAVEKVSDYESGEVTAAGTAIGETGLPKSNVIAFDLADGCRLVVRPSGTEPKIKIYLTARGKDAAEAQKRTDAMTADIKKILHIKD